MKYFILITVLFASTSLLKGQIITNNYSSVKIYMESFGTNHILGGQMYPDSLRNKCDTKVNTSNFHLVNCLIDGLNKNIETDRPKVYPTHVFGDSKVLIDFYVNDELQKSFVISSGGYIADYKSGSDSIIVYDGSAMICNLKEILPLYNGYFIGNRCDEN